MAAQAKAPVSRKRALSAAPPPSFEACVVTYISQERAFQRVFAEMDIEGMKKVVREKLNLAPDANVRLAQVAEGRRIDLEDDADFYAFQLGARLKPELQVEVSVTAAPAAQLASPSVTATSINLERAPPPALIQTEQGENPQTTDVSTSAPPPRKRKKPRKSNLVLAKDDAGEGGSKLMEPTGPITNGQAPKVAKSKAKAVDPVPPAITTEPSKKPKSKAKTTPPADQEVLLTLEESKQPEDTVAEAPSAPPKSKKGKKVTTTTTPAPEAAPTSEAEPIPNTTSGNTEIPQSRLKKRGRKAAQDAEQQDPVASETVKVEPPAKKQRKSKSDVVVERASSQSPVATTLPPPVRSERRSSTVLSVADPEKPASIVGSPADILRRWGAKSAAAAEAAASSEAELSTATGAVDQNTETKAVAKKRKKKKKDQAADDAPTSALALAPTPAEAPQCLVCTSDQHESLDCSLLSQRDSDTAKIVEERILSLEDTQGPARIHQMLIGRLRSWLKDTKKQVEAQNIPTSAPAPAVQKSTTPAHSTPAPTRPKKSKLSSVAVSHQSEGSSTEDEDILKSVMESRIESTEEDDGEDEEMADAPPPEPEPEPGLQVEATPPSTPTPSPSPTAVPLPPSSPPATKALLQSQRMSQSSVRALLDGLESEEAGDGENDSSDEEGSDLAQSTPSEVARRRHRKSVRLDVQDSDEEATARAQTQVQDEDEEVEGEGEEGDSDVEMRDPEEERNLATLSQLLDSSQNIPEEIVGVVVEEKDDDDIEEYEDEGEKENKEAPDDAADSPIEISDQEPAVAEDRAAGTPEQGKEREQEDEPEPERGLKPEQDPELVAPAPKKRGRLPLSQLVKEERATEKARIQAEKAPTQADPPAPKKRGRPPKSKGVEEGANSSGKPLSTGPSQEQSDSVSGSQEPGPRPRGRPRLSDAVKAERQAEKERIRAEKAIQRLEKKTAKANAKAAAKGKGANASATVDDGEEEGDEGDEEEEDATVRQSFHAPEEPAESPVVPSWSTLKNPPSSRPGSSQADEIEWSATEAGDEGGVKRPLGSQSSAVKPTPSVRKTGAAKPLFMPSSGLGPRILSLSTPITSTPAPGKLLSLSQQTPSNTLQRRKSIGSASLPRFTDIRKYHDLQQRSRKERNKLLSSQPVKLDSSQELKPKPNGTGEDVFTIESSDEEADSSGDQKEKPKPLSQRKRPSAFAYFEH